MVQMETQFTSPNCAYSSMNGQLEGIRVNLYAKSPIHTQRTLYDDNTMAEIHSARVEAGLAHASYQSRISVR